MLDPFGRPTRNFRISVTQRCNLRCVYCHREGETRSDTEMTVDEIVEIVKLGVELGIKSVKLTGGEPLVREDILEIVKGISRIQGIEDLSMTTNGNLLHVYADNLVEAGLNRVNVSLPTLDEKKYRAITGGDLKPVISGIKAAVDAGLNPVKLNMVYMKGVNTDEVYSMIDFAAETGTILQVIELEPINLDEDFYQKHHASLDGLVRYLSGRAIEVKVRRNMQNRRVYVLPEAKVEVVPPIENTEFCMHCTRIRLTSDGKLKPCLMRQDNLVDILTPMRNGADKGTLKNLFIEAIKRRRPYFMPPR
ncbi:GTP 3',8-cyclase MoaA [Candidatus Bathyarchaeota archaeon]|nr:GTP 3',8-cyclase MoaA [Candidatus Bathyarchaeota archaeon]